MHVNRLFGSVGLASIVVLSGCAGTPFKWEDTAKVRNGMTEAEVIAILGQPYARSQSGNVTVLMWTFAHVFGGAKAVSYRFVDGHVTGSTGVGQ